MYIYILIFTFAYIYACMCIFVKYVLVHIYTYRVTRALVIEIFNESSSPMIKYYERVTYSVDPESQERTIISQTGHSECDIPFMMGQFGDDM